MNRKTFEAMRDEDKLLKCQVYGDDVDIETEQWNSILKHCIKNGWSIEYKYNEFDAGIDYDLVILRNTS